RCAQPRALLQRGASAAGRGVRRVPLRGRDRGCDRRCRRRSRRGAAEAAPNADAGSRGRGMSTRIDPYRGGSMQSHPRAEALRCVLVGTGAVAHLHAAAVAAHPHARLVAVADLSAERADAFAAQHGVPASYGDYDRMLATERPDVVLICTPPAPHREQALAAFAAGAHVIVEKPPAPSLDELDDMRAAAAAADRQLAVVFQQRTGTAAAHVRGLLRSGALGRPL